MCNNIQPFLCAVEDKDDSTAIKTLRALHEPSFKVCLVAARDGDWTTLMGLRGVGGGSVGGSLSTTRYVITSIASASGLFNQGTVLQASQRRVGVATKKYSSKCIPFAG